MIVRRKVKLFFIIELYFCPQTLKPYIHLFLFSQTSRGRVVTHARTCVKGKTSKQNSIIQKTRLNNLVYNMFISVVI